jgi:predicted dehydrogenase
MERETTTRKLGVAVVGLGKYGEGQIIPALQETQHAYLAGIVSGSPQKCEKWKQQSQLPGDSIYNYQTFDSIKDNAAIDIVYVALPNALHAEYVIKAAKAGKHVICEKPMATSVEDCEKMIAACKQAGKMLSIGYRLHFEPHNQEMMRLGQKKIFGNITHIEAGHGMSSAEGWRLNKALAGGGPLMDVGIYCVQAARYTTGMEPIAVTACFEQKKHPEKNKEVEEAISWQMEFADGTVADCKCSYAEKINMLKVQAENGWFELSPAYSYTGIEGKTPAGKMDIPNVRQQTKQIDDFAMAIKENRPTPVPGEMGLQDVKILVAIYKAANTGKKVAIS